MLKDLPDFVQSQVLQYLESDNFVAAKSLHDAWMRLKMLKTNHKPRNRPSRKYKSTSKNSLLPDRQAKLIEKVLYTD